VSEVDARHQRLLALAALLAFALAFQGSRGLWEPDEGRYSAVAVEMVEGGDWLTPRLNDRVPHFTKPPLTYWLLAGSVAAFGANEWALRLPNALAFAGTVLLVLGIGRRLVPQRPELAALIHATSLLPFVAANALTTDTLLSLWETLAVFGFVAACWDPPGSRWGIPVMWAGFGLAMLTKGPPGLLPLPALAMYLAAASGFRALRRLVSPLGLALFVLLGLGWYALAAATHPGLLDYWLGGEVVGRAAGAFQGKTHLRGALEVYGPVLLAGPLPWTLVALASWARRGRFGSSESVPGRPALLLTLWLFLPLAAFALAPARLELYLVPLAVPASLLLARVLAPRWRWTRPTVALVGLWVLALVILRWGGGWWPNEKRDGRAFAAEVARQLPQRPEVAVFVDSLPRWSLAVYLDCEVDSVDLAIDRRAKEGPRYAPLHANLGELLEWARGDTVFFVPTGSEPRFANALAAADRSAERVGRVLDLGLFLLAPE
jgi:4-amino-4-deoxy-L-arabinose transferase